MSEGVKFYDQHTIYIDTSVATERQVVECTQKAIEAAEKILQNRERCKFRVNLIVGKDGAYYGFGYIRVSDPRVYWLLLGYNSDGSPRIEEYPDPNWQPPVEKPKNLSGHKNWFELVKEEDSYIRPMIKKELGPLVVIPGYEYNEEQKKHLTELENAKNLELDKSLKEKEKEKEKEKAIENHNEKLENSCGTNGTVIPNHGFFILSRAYALEPGPQYMRNKLCAKFVPDWIPLAAFKSIFGFYVSEESRNRSKDTYPVVNFLESKKSGRMVFITYDPNSTDAIFALLMSKKTRIAHPSDSSKKAVLIFTHALSLKR